MVALCFLCDFMRFTKRSVFTTVSLLCEYVFLLSCQWFHSLLASYSRLVTLLVVLKLCVRKAKSPCHVAVSGTCDLLLVQLAGYASILLILASIHVPSFVWYSHTSSNILKSLA